MNQGKLLLLHGQGIINSRKKLIDIKGRYKPEDITVFSGNINIEELLGNLMTINLLAAERLVVIENPPDTLEVKYLDLPDGVTVVFWLDHEVTATKLLLKLVKSLNGEILFFAPDKEVSVFPFLDALGNRDKKAFILLEQLKAEKIDLQYTITMILYLLRSLVAPNDNVPQFVKNKLSKQLQNFSMEGIKANYRFILETDFKLKSGLIEKKQAEFQIVQKFMS